MSKNNLNPNLNPKTNFKTTRSGFIFLAHGSRRKESNQEIKEVFTRVKKIMTSDYDLWRVAFLELADPSLSVTIDELVEREGVNEISVFPYFLAAGNHIHLDIPEIIEEKKQKFPLTKIRLLHYFGYSKNVAKFIAEAIKVNS